MPLLGRGANELLEPVREILGDASDVVAKPAFTLRGHRRHHDRMVPALGPEVHRRRKQRRAGPQRQCRRPARQRGPLAEELDLDPVADQVAVTQQAHDLVVPQRLQHDPAGVGAELDDGHAECPPDPREPLEQLRRLDRLDDDRGRDALGRQPRAGEVPAADVREREDHASPVLEAGGDVVEPLDVELERAPRVVGEAEQLEPIAAVRTERLGDRLAQREPLQRSVRRAAQVPLDLPPPAEHGQRHRLPDHARRRLRHRPGHDPGELGARSVREIRRAGADRVLHWSVRDGCGAARTEPATAASATGHRSGGSRP